MNFKPLLITAILLLSCVEKPTENELLDLDNFRGFTNLERFTTRIEILPTMLDVTDSVNYGVLNWKIVNDEFSIQLEPLFERLDSIGVDIISGDPIYDTVYTTHRYYNVYLESLDGISFAGIDSLTMFFEIQVINSNPFYDTENLLLPARAVVQYRGLGIDPTYYNIIDLQSLLASDIRYQFRISLQISTGYNGFNPGDQFQFNRPVYKVRFQLSGISRQ